MEAFPINLRRVRQNPQIRNLLADIHLGPDQLIQPYFIYQELKEAQDLNSLFKQKKHTVESLLRAIELGLENRVSSVLLFAIPKDKNESHFNYDFEAVAVEQVKKRFGNDVVLFVDICLCSNTKSGHCGICANEKIDNNQSVLELTRKAFILAQAGADVLSPSDMMDDRILSMRNKLDQERMPQKLIMSYSTKFSSAFYGPFREAAESTPQFGDRKTYQIDYRNLKDAINSSIRDAEQGADILMVKPAGAYLDIIKELKLNEKTKHLPLSAYQVSGEYQSLHLMSQAGMLDFKLGFLETLYAIKRAGADLIITYGANDFINYQNSK